MPPQSGLPRIRHDGMFENSATPAPIITANVTATGPRNPTKINAVVRNTGVKVRST